MRSKKGGKTDKGRKYKVRPDTWGYKINQEMTINNNKETMTAGRVFEFCTEDNFRYKGSQIHA